MHTTGNRKRDAALREFMAPFSTKQAVNRLMADGQIESGNRLDAWAERHPVIFTVIATLVLWGLAALLLSL